MTAISDKYNSLGGAGGFLGAATTAELANADGAGVHQNFQGGVIYWHPDLGAYEVHGAILGRWSALGNETSPLGYPMTDESSASGGQGRFNHFQHGSIYWTPATGAHDVQGRIRERWSLYGWERGFLGYPVLDQWSETRGRDVFNISRFQGGRIERNTGSGEVLTFHTPSLSLPNYIVPVAALQVRDSNTGARPANITAAQVQLWVDYANPIYAAAGLHFEFNGQLNVLDDTDVNNLTGDRDPFWIQARDRLNQRAAQEQALLLVFRHGPGLTPTGAGFSWWDYDFVVMPGFTGQMGLLPHEMGHYFGLPHTHGPSFNTENEAADFFLSRFNNPAIFDADANLRDQNGNSIIYDTPPDPFIRDIQYDTTRYAVSLAGAPFALARDNPMGYWGNPNHQFFSLSQIMRIRHILVERLARIPLNVTVIDDPVSIQVTPYPVPLNRLVTVTVSVTEIDTGAAVAGQVIVNGKVVGSTNIPFQFTFKTRRRKIPPPDGGWEIIFPEGFARLAFFGDKPIDFGF